MTLTVLRAARLLPCLVLAAGIAAPALFDTNMDSDGDDAGAMAMLHAMADAGEVRILVPVEFAPGAEARVQETIEALMGVPPAKR